jgi:hypothetical protein
MDPAVPPPRQAMDSAASLDVDPRAPVDGIVMEEDGGNGILRSHYVESQGVSVIEVADLRLPSVATAVSRRACIMLQPQVATYALILFMSCPFECVPVFVSRCTS